VEFSYYYEPGDLFFSTVNQAAEYFAKQGLSPQVLPYGSIVTMEVNYLRVRIYHDEENPNKILSISIG
jgi:hypothetical protein